MKLNKFTSYLALLGLGFGAVAAPTLKAQNLLTSSSGTPAITNPAVPLVQDFTGFNHGSTVSAPNTLPTLPGGFSLNGTPSNFSYRGLGTGSSGTGGYYSYGTNSGDTDRALGVLEQASNELRDARIAFKFLNDTNADIERLFIKYNVELWRDGERRNRLRMRYSSLQNPDITDNDDWSDILIDVGAIQNAGGNAVLNGNNFVSSGSAVVVLDNAGDNRGVLSDGNTASVRWQYSSTTGEDSGSRDGLGLDDINIQVLPSGDRYEWRGAANDVWSTSDAEWHDGSSIVVWNNVGKNAVFNGNGGSPVELASAGATAVDLVVEANPSGGGSYLIQPDSGSPVLELEGLANIATGLTATVDVLLDVDETKVPGLVKIGDGKLVLSESNNPFTGGLTITDGEVELGANNALDSDNLVDVAAGAIFDVNGNTTTINGLRGAEGSFVTLGSNGSLVFTLDVENGAQAQHRGSLSGTVDTVVKTGPGLQKFQTEDKTFTGKLLVEDGILQITENCDLTNTTEIKVTSGTGVQGIFYLINDETTAQDYSYPVAIKLESGYLHAESDGGVNLLSGVELVSGVNRIYSSGDVAHEFHIDGAITGSGNMRKNGSGILFLNNASNTYTGETDINNGTIVVPSTGSLGGGKLWLTDPDENRELILEKSVTVAGLEGNSQELPAAQTGFITLDGSITFTIDQGAALDGGGEEIKPSYQGDFREDTPADTGIVVKTGLGTTRMTRQPKAFTGHVKVNNGVLEVSESGQFTNVAEIEVNSGGQLRLTSGSNSIGSPVVYDFGGNVVLKSTARSLGGVITGSSGFGELGGLRVDGNTVVTPPEEPELYTELASNVVVSAASDIHVNGTDAILFLTGALSGSADLDRTGGGTFVIDGSATGYSGIMTLTNGVTELGNNVEFGGTIYIPNGGDTLLIGAGAATVNGDVVAEGGIISFDPASSQTLQVDSTVDLSNWTIDLNGIGNTNDDYTIFTTVGGASVTTPTITGYTGTGTPTVTVVGNDVVLTIP